MFKNLFFFWKNFNCRPFFLFKNNIFMFVNILSFKFILKCNLIFFIKTLRGLTFKKIKLFNNFFFYDILLWLYVYFMVFLFILFIFYLI